MIDIPPWTPVPDFWKINGPDDEEEEDDHDSDDD